MTTYLLLVSKDSKHMGNCKLWECPVVCQVIEPYILFVIADRYLIVHMLLIRVWERWEDAVLARGLPCHTA